MTAAELECAFAALAEAILLGVRREMRPEVATALSGTVCDDPDTFPPDCLGYFDRADGLIHLSPRVSLLVVAELFAHEVAHRATYRAASAWWLPDTTPHHCPTYYGLVVGTQRRWMGKYRGDRAYDFSDRPFLMSRRFALRIAKRCAARIDRMPIDAAARACWLETCLVEGLWRLGEFIERHAGRLLLLAGGLLAVGLSHLMCSLLAAAETAFMAIIGEWAVASLFPSAFDFPLQLNRRSNDV
jgi:hypothetical protein